VNNQREEGGGWTEMERERERQRGMEREMKMTTRWKRGAPAGEGERPLGTGMDALGSR